MNRRNFIKFAGAVAISTSLAGCYSGTKSGKFKITDLGVVKKNESAATYLTVKNVSDEKEELEASLAAYDPDGVRVSDWNTVTSDGILPGERRSLYVVYDAESVGWFNSNNLGQVIQTHHTRVREVDTNFDPEGPIMGEEAIGKTFKKARKDAQS